MPNPVVSVIMPAFNAEKFIAESISSVIAQTYKDWELLIVDDGSADNTKKIIQDFCNRDRRIKYYYQPNGKQGKARNLAISFSKGEYLAFLDADDIWFPQKLDIQLQQIAEKQVDLIFSEAYTFTDNVSMPDGPMGTGRGFFSGEAGLRAFLEINRILPSSVLVKSEVIKDVGGFTESPLIPQAEDYHLWLKLLMGNYAFFGSELILAGYRIHPASDCYEDRLVVTRVLEALQDLKLTHKDYKKLIATYHKKWFIKYHFSSNNWDKRKYRALIKKNCLYLAGPLHNLFFQITYKLIGFEFTRRVLNKVVNHHWNTKRYFIKMPKLKMVQH